MSDRSTEILEEALSLSPTERAELAERLLSSLDTPDRQRLDELWAAEVEERLDAYERGEIKTNPAKQVFDQIGCKNKLILSLPSSRV
jgi:putative addiction module component (TIGR02574 family)